MTASPHTSEHDPTAPLQGRSVVVTRTREQSRALAEPLAVLGAEVLAMPLLDIVEPPDPDAVDSAVRELESYHWVVFTSTNAVDRFLARVVSADALDALSHVKVAAVGTSTAERLREQGIEPDLVPADARAEGLVEAFRALGVGHGLRVLVPRALKAREVFPEALRAMGARVDIVAVYQTVPVPADPAVIERLRAGTVDCVTFTSGAIARAFVSAIGAAGLDPDAALRHVALASIGPVTTREIAKLGYRVDIEAPEATMGSLAAAVGAYFGATG